MTTIDDTHVRKALDKLTNQLSGRQHKNAFNRAARKGANVLKKEVRNEIVDDGSFEHIKYLRRNVKVLNSKSRTKAGVNIRIKAADVPVGTGKHRRFWKASSYSRLVFYGNYKTPGRRTKKGTKRGDVKGIFRRGYDPFKEAAKKHGKKAVQIAIANLRPEIEKETRKASA